MRKTLNMTIIFVFGVLIGATTASYFTVSARRSYRELLQANYLLDQSARAYKALRENNDIKAAVYLWNQVEVDPIDGSNMFNKDIIKQLDESLWFIFFPETNKMLNKLVHIKPGSENRAKGIAHGKLAAVLQRLGQTNAAKQHWMETSRLLNMSEEEAQQKFMVLIEKIKDQQDNNFMQ